MTFGHHDPDLFEALEELLRQRRAELAELVGVCDALVELHGLALAIQASSGGPVRMSDLEAAAGDEEERARLAGLLDRATGEEPEHVNDHEEREIAWQL